MKNLNITLLIFFCLSCDRWDYDEKSRGQVSYAPETYLTLVASDTIYTRIDSSGGKVFSFVKPLGPSMEWDTLDQAFKSITTSKQVLNWWGEDLDGEILGYYYKWSSDTSWTFTDLESGVFYVPIRSELDVFSFEVKSIDNEGNMDQSPSKIVLPVKNSPPSISFRFLSNPQIADIGSDTSYTFPTRTFNWDITDLDGNETVQNIFYSLNDSCETCWTRISGDQSSITLTDIKVGENTFHIWCQDIAGAKSEIISFPDSANVNDAQVWVVKPVQGDILIVDDYPLDNENNTLSWYSSIMDTLVGETGYSVWELSLIHISEPTRPY